MENYNRVLMGLIKILNEEKLDIMEIEIKNQSVFYLVRSFSPPATGALGSTPYVRIEGFDISADLETAQGMGANTALVSKFKDLLSKKPQKLDFSDNHTWRFYTLS